MNPQVLKEIDGVSRLAGQRAGGWIAANGIVHTDEGEEIAKFREAGAASYVARLHNIFLIVFGELCSLRKRLNDKHSMERDHGSKA